MNRNHYNNVVRHALGEKFGSVFARSLSGFFTNGGGFDITAFSSALCDGGGDVLDRVQRRYGDAGAAIVRKLMGMEPLSDAEKEVASRMLGRYYVAEVADCYELYRQAA